MNPLHGSENKEKAAEEIQKFFPMEHTLSVIKPNQLSEKGKGSQRAHCTSKLFHVFVLT